jgi:hypothetical protein
MENILYICLNYRTLDMKTNYLEKSIFCSLFLLSATLFSQNTLNYNDEKGSPKVTLQDVNWLIGNWKGESDFGNYEENWSPSSGKTMLFSFKMWNDDAVGFYEIGHIVEQENSLLLQMKHFDKNLKSLGKQDEAEDFRFIKMENNRIYFDKITYEKVSDSEMNVYVFMEESGDELKFNFKK